MGELIIFTFTKFPELPQSMAIRDVLTVPSEEIVYFPDYRHCNVERVAYFVFWDISFVQILPSEEGAFFVQCQNRKLVGLLEAF